MRIPLLIAASAVLVAVRAKEIVVTVGGNTTSSPGAVFTPQEVKAIAGDVVIFNFTQGNHTATQSTFASPCVPAHTTDSTINSFDSSFRQTDNGTAITQLSVTVPDNTSTIWFYDSNTCGLGGVGGININGSSDETLDGFERNAIRLNGTETLNASSSTSQTAGATATSPSSTTTTTSAANRAIVLGLSGVMPALAMLLVLTL
ncbi:hypothetical protein GALMADRAFT_140303 [Galerina marginata CBS 339.88]|uniref:Phytocyanin domain-containing protein n=1 Tax=Galerina marginata (strain CBS 339.88) TaxID=685588 RepID=A0A067T9K1_GALM3|nr:hypothetical protein GALMADRAFT_140303 [Galerina marginata CBS 339.88]